MKQWLLHPFVRLGGGKALLAGTVLLLLTAVAAWFSRCHFDGLIDAHQSRYRGAWWPYLAEPFLNLVVGTACFYLAGRLSSRSAIRLIDVAGTLAFARWPMLAVALLFLLPLPEPGQVPNPAGLLTLMLILLASIAMIGLMYQAYTVSCNVKGTKATWSFIAALLAGEVLTKLLYAVLIPLY